MKITTSTTFNIKPNKNKPLKGIEPLTPSTPEGIKRVEALEKKIEMIAREIGLSEKEIKRLNVVITADRGEASVKLKKRCEVFLPAVYLMEKEELEQLGNNPYGWDIADKINNICGFNISRYCNDLNQYIPTHTIEPTKDKEGHTLVSSENIKDFTIRHELAHIKNSDSTRSMVVSISLLVSNIAIPALIAGALVSAGAVACALTAGSPIGVAVLVALSIAAVGSFCLSFVALAPLNNQLRLLHSRHREKQADLTALKSVPDQKAVALAHSANYRWNDVLKTHREKLKKKPYLKKKIKPNGDFANRNSHPKLEDRIKYTNQFIEKKMKKMRAAAAA